jgi:hypothetical protein
MLDRVWTITNALIKRTQGGATDKTLEELSTIMKDPKQTAKLMEVASGKEKNALKWLQRYQTLHPYAIGGVINANMGQQ